MISDEEIQQLRNEAKDEVADEIITLRIALYKIATSKGNFNAAKIYREIARQALGLKYDTNKTNCSSFRGERQSGLP